MTSEKKNLFFSLMSINLECSFSNQFAPLYIFLETISVKQNRPMFDFRMF